MAIRFLIVCGGSGVNLLGQRQVLGMDAELQIDVSRENVVRQWESQDSRSFVLELDRSVGTSGLLFKEALEHIREDGQVPQEDERVSKYIQEGIYHEGDIRHTRFLAQHSVVNMALERQLTQPAIGGLAIRHPENRLGLEQIFGRMTAGRGLGPENSLEVWIVSSTAGGTGEGIHRFVAAYLAEFLRRRYTETPLTVNFVRVGPLTYETVDKERTDLNTFFGVAADAGFALKSTKEFPGLATYWFYVDVPDVGTGAQSIPMRAQIVEMAAKAVMLEELQGDLQELLVNNRGIPMILIRTGYWERDFGKRRKYYETLRQLRKQLRKLVEPEYEKEYIGGDERQVPQFESEKRLGEWAELASDAEYVLKRMEEGWQFPPYQIQGYPKSLEVIREEVGQWKTVLEEMLRQDLDGLRTNWMVDRVREKGVEIQQETVPLRVSKTREVEFGQREWFQRVDEAHEALAWSRALLGCDLQQGRPRTGGRWNEVEKLLESARGISRTLHGFSPFRGAEPKTRRAAAELGEFLRKLLEVDLLLRLEQEARRVLEAELSGARRILDMVESEFQAVHESLTAPDYGEYITGHDENTIVFSGASLAPWIERAGDEQNVLERLQEGWRFPRLRSKEFPEALEELRLQVTEWKRAIANLLKLNWEGLKVEYLLKDVAVEKGKEQEQEIPLGVSALMDEMDEWDERVEKAHRVRAWVWHLLGCDLEGGSIGGENTLVGELFNQAQAISRVFHRFPFFDNRLSFLDTPEKKAERITHLMKDFLLLLAKVDYLLTVEEETKDVLNRELQEREGAVLTAKLPDTLERLHWKTWLQRLHATVHRGDRWSFRREVLKGAIGLTETGLRYVLGLRPQGDANELLDELGSHMGQIVDGSGEVHEAPWWAGKSVNSALSYEYRILPPVDSALRERLLTLAAGRATAFRFVFTPALSELSVVALSATSLAHEFGDTLTAPKTLVEPFLPAVKTALDKWNRDLAGVPVGQLAIINAGVAREALYKDALRAAGLGDEDLDRIGHYYRYYTRGG